MTINQVFLSFDPAITACGFVIYDYTRNVIELSQSIIYKDADKRAFRKKCIADGSITEENEKKMFGNMWKNERLSNILKVLNEKSVEKKVTFVISESQFGAYMTDSGTLPKIVAGNLNVPYIEFKPKSWKKILTGNGNCEQKKINEMVENFTGSFYKYLDEHQIDAFSFILTYLKQNDLPIIPIKP